MTSVGPPAAGLTVPTMWRILIRWGWLLGVRIPSRPADGMPRGGEALGSGAELACDGGERLAEAANVGFEVPGGDAGFGSLTHALSLFRVGDDPVEGGGEGFDVADRVDVTLDAVGDEIGVCADFVGDDDRTASSHGLVDDQAPGFVPGG